MLKEIQTLGTIEPKYPNLSLRLETTHLLFLVSISLLKFQRYSTILLPFLCVFSEIDILINDNLNQTLLETPYIGYKQSSTVSLSSNEPNKSSWVCSTPAYSLNG